MGRRAGDGRRCSWKVVPCRTVTVVVRVEDKEVVKSREVVGRKASCENRPFRKVELTRTSVSRYIMAGAKAKSGERREKGQ
jgi:hypothetical protein